MSQSEPIKLIPRNAPALRKTVSANSTPRLVPGNPVSTRLESGIGNCYPGLECDLRNLERRFFPFLEIDMPDATMDLVSVDIEGATAEKNARAIDAKTFKGYQMLAGGGQWMIESMKGTFGPLGTLAFNIRDLGIPSTGARRLPADPWTAVRLLSEGTDVRIVMRRNDLANSATTATLTGKRARYLGDDGALAAMFAPGELTQSLCSPWTHDFRDCGCFYWASNHPDIALPPLPSAPTDDPKWDIAVPWERSDRRSNRLPAPATFNDPTDVELLHVEINRRWQALNFVVEGREQVGPYAQRPFVGKPLRDVTELEAHLRYAAGVELAVVHEYLAAAYSLKPEQGLKGGLRDDVRAARAEIMRIAIGEMRHIRAVNDVLAALLGRPAYKPALQVATQIPGSKPNQRIAVKPAPLTRAVLESFIAIEAPSLSVDGVYARILATLNMGSREADIQAIRTVMAEGEDHYRTFRAIREWLAPHQERQYLRGGNPKKAPAGNSANKALQERYRRLLNLLYDGYNAGLPDGALQLNEARNAMIEPGGIVDAAEAVAQNGFLVVFDPPNDSRFAPIEPP